MGAAKIGDQLLDGDAVGEAIVDDGIIQRAGGDAAVVLRFHAGGTAVSVRKIFRAGFSDLRLRDCGQIRSGLNLRVILKGDLLCLLQGEALRCRGRRRSLRRRLLPHGGMQLRGDGRAGQGRSNQQQRCGEISATH